MLSWHHVWPLTLLQSCSRHLGSGIKGTKAKVESGRVLATEQLNPRVPPDGTQQGSSWCEPGAHNRRTTGQSCVCRTRLFDDVITFYISDQKIVFLNTTLKKVLNVPSPACRYTACLLACVLEGELRGRQRRQRWKTNVAGCSQLVPSCTAECIYLCVSMTIPPIYFWEKLEKSSALVCMCARVVQGVQGDELQLQTQPFSACLVNIYEKGDWMKYVLKSGNGCGYFSSITKGICWMVQKL